MNNQWCYISTRDNPADCASRGISATELVHHELWWNNPKWFCESPEKWPKQPVLKFESSDFLEKRTCLNTHSTLTDLEYLEILTRFSSLNHKR